MFLPFPHLLFTLFPPLQIVLVLFVILSLLLCVHLLPFVHLAFLILGMDLCPMTMFHKHK